MKLYLRVLFSLAVVGWGAVVGEAGAKTIPHEIWVTDQANDKVLVYASGSLRLLGEIAVDNDGKPATSKPHYISFSPDFRYAYVANVGSSTVTVIDAAKRKVLAQVKAGKGAHAAIPSPDGKRVWVANPGDNTVTEILVNYGRFTAGRTIPLDARTMLLTFSPDGKQAYVTNSGKAKTEDPAQTGSIAIIDVESGTVIKKLSNTGQNTLAPHWSEDHAHLYVSVGSPMDQLLVVDPSSGELRQTPLPAGVKDPHAIAVTPDGTRLIVVARQEAKLQVYQIDGAQVTATAEIAVGEKPDMLALSPDGTRAYVTLRGQAVTGDPFALSGPTPGLAAADLTERKRMGFVSIDRGDPHGLAVRPLARAGSFSVWWALLGLLALGALVLLMRR